MDHQTTILTNHILGTACMHLMGIKLYELCDRPESFQTRQGIRRAILKYKDRTEKYRSTTPQDIMLKAASLLRDAREEGFEYIPLSGINKLFNPVENYRATMNTFPGVFVATKNVDALRESMRNPTLAIIGTRDMSPYGKDQTHHLVYNNANKTIITGFSLGISEMAIKNALDNGTPVIAVSAAGAGNIYPAAMREFHERLKTTPGCAVVTPYFPDEAPMAINFLLRNHLIALADETVVVEAKAKGGAIVTARLAYDFGKRSVKAIPGRINDIRSSGCNQLIKEGIAEIITNL